MSSLVRRMQRVATRDKTSGIPQFGSQLGVTNPKAKDLLAREDRQERKRRPQSLGDMLASELRARRFFPAGYVPFNGLTVAD